MYFKGLIYFVTEKFYIRQDKLVHSTGIQYKLVTKLSQFIGLFIENIFVVKL